MNPSEILFKTRSFWIFFIVTSLTYLILNWIFSVNFVWNYDDASIVIESFMTYHRDEISLFEYLRIFVNNHPIAIERLLAVITYWLLGAIDIKVILLLSSLFPILLSYLINVDEHNIYKCYMTHILLLSFTNSVFLWTSASAVYFMPFFFFTVIVLKVLSREGSFWTAICLTVLLLLMFYSFSNSLVAIPILVAVFLLKKEKNRKTLFHLIPFIVISIVFLVDFYLSTNYVSSASVNDSGGMQLTLHGMLKGITFVLVYCGSFAKYLSFSPQYQVYLSFVFGLCLFCILLRHLYLNKKNVSPWFWLGLFGFGSGSLVMLGRFDGLDYQYAIDNRYEWFGVITLIAVMQMVMPDPNKMKLKSIASSFIIFTLLLAGLKTGWNTLNLPRYERLHHNRASHFLNETEFDIPFKTEKRNNDARKIKSLMLEAQEMGIFYINPDLYQYREL